MTPPSGARFTRGSTMRHIAEMTATGSIGIMAIFLVDFLSLFYISRLGEDALTAGVGYATTVLFIAVSANIGAMIAGSALVSRAIGAASQAAAGERAALEDEARRLACSSLVLASLFSALVALLLWLAAPTLLSRLGAGEQARLVALRFLDITLPANILMSAGLMFSGYLRAQGDARRAMAVTLYGGLVTALTDPLLIFVAGLGPAGAAWATALSRLVFALVGWNGVLRKHRLLRLVSPAEVAGDARRMTAIAGPAILTNLATPVGSLLFLHVITPFGPAAVAAYAIFERVVPVGFGVLFALSASVGPILGQNLGARLPHRLHRTMRESYLLATGYALFAASCLALLREPIAAFFGVSGATAEYLRYFCLYGGTCWVFIGLVLVSNSAFNNLGFPLHSTLVNWSRATLGTFPPAYLGAQWGGVKGAMIAVIIGNAIIGIAAVVITFSVIGRLRRRLEAS